MNITFEELRSIKHSLPTGSIRRIAKALELKEQTVRNFFGASRYKVDEAINWHWEPGPNGGIVQLVDTRILDLANSIIRETRVALH